MDGAQAARRLQQHADILRGLQHPSGLFVAAAPTGPTGYEKAWLRDNVYEALAFQHLEEWDVVADAYTALLDTLCTHEDKIDWAIEEKPAHPHQHIHARIHPETFAEYEEEWGNKQHDAIGAILYALATAEPHLGLLQAPHYRRIAQKLVRYLESVAYWQDPDNGMWEEAEELHASSIGACTAGLQEIRGINGITVPARIINNGRAALEELLPRESASKLVDLAQLSLLWPYDIASDEHATQILENVEYHLVRRRGVIRYKADAYYNANSDEHSEEAEWTMGLAWLAIIHHERGNDQRAREYLARMQEAETPRGFPELYYSNSDEHNENTPLGWAQSLYCIAQHKILLCEQPRRSQHGQAAAAAA